MRDADRKDFYQAWAACWEQCGKAVTDRLLRFAFESLRDYELSEIQAGLLAHARDPDQGQYAPKPADVIRQIEGGGDERAMRAWAKVERAVTQVGPWKPLAFDDPAIHACIEEMGGFPVFCRATLDDWNILRSWFTKIYRSHLRRPPTTYPAVIWGEGGRREELQFIGDSAKAQAVLEGGSDSTTAVTEARHLLEAMG